MEKEQELQEINARIKEIDDTIRDSDGDYSSFELADDIKSIENNSVRVALMLHYIDKLWGIPAVTDEIARNATEEEKKEILKVFEENGIRVDYTIFPEKAPIEMKIAKIAAKNWGDTEPTTIEEASKITGKSEIASIEGIAKVVGLDEYDIDVLIGMRDEEGNPLLDGQIYTRDTISEDIAKKISDGIYNGDKNDSVLKILSTIHDKWVKNNSNNFLKVNDKGERRNKERQFVPLELLDWGEVQSDLLFLKPILEASGIELDEQQLKSRFEIAQQEFLLDNGITSHEKLVEFLSKGSKSYPALDGIETKFGGNIDQLLQDPKVAEEMARQIESRVKIKSAKEIGEEVLYSNNPELDDVLWANTIVDNPTFREDKCPRINGPISRREVLLSKAIGIPYPTYITSGISNDSHDEYRNELRRPRDSEWDIVDIYKDSIEDIKKKLPTQIIKQELLNGDGEIGFVKTSIDEIYANSMPEPISRAMPKKMYDLGNTRGIVFPKDITRYDGDHGEDILYETRFVPSKHTSGKEKTEIEKRKAKVEKFQKKVLDSKDGKYDKKGILYLPEFGYRGEPSDKPIEIEVTQRELAEAGILPEDFKWKQKALVSSKDIAGLDKEQALTTIEVGGVRGFLNRLMDKFKGKGEI